MAMTKSQAAVYVGKRLFHSIFTMLLLSVLIFLFLRAIPGDPVLVLMGEGGEISMERYAMLQHELGLDQPLPVQFFKWLSRVSVGEFGESMRTGEAVLPDVLKRLQTTLELALSAVLLGSLFGIVAGIVAAVKRNTVFDHIATISSLVGISIPVFWMGIMMIIFFSVQWSLLPMDGMMTIGLEVTRVTGFPLIDSLITGNFTASKDILAHMIMPAITLAVTPAALTARTTRASMLEVIHEDYVKAGLARGLTFTQVLCKHAFRNALIPVITVIGLQIGIYLGGSIVTETVFSWPGLGRLVVDAIYNRDYPVVQGAVFVYAILIVAVNLIVDLLYAKVDPRVEP